MSGCSYDFLDFVSDECIQKMYIVNVEKHGPRARYRPRQSFGSRHPSLLQSVTTFPCAQNDVWQLSCKPSKDNHRTQHSTAVSVVNYCQQYQKQMLMFVVRVTPQYIRKFWHFCRVYLEINTNKYMSRTDGYYIWNALILSAPKGGNVCNGKCKFL